jgi:glucosamine--fructose-6-phosphate aminotransferase (isomerizing)
MANTIHRFFDRETGKLNHQALGLEKLNLKKIDNIHIIACGTAYLSGMIGRYTIESLAKVSVNTELASEFRYRDPVLNERSLVIAISQSGETMDTLESLKFAKSKGCQIFSICNAHHSSIPRESHAVLYMDAGPEIGVASTKAFTSMVLCQYLFALALAELRGVNIEGERKKAVNALRVLPGHVDTILAASSKIMNISDEYYESSNFLYIGRGEHYPVALEGALKLKEISYIHAEAYASGELKHGPIALIDRNMPVFVLAPKDKYYDKTISNIEQVRARNGRIIAIGAEGDSQLEKLSDNYFSYPQVDVPALQTILSTVPLQIFSYYMALKRGTDVDQPRNLAKSVTVE